MSVPESVGKDGYTPGLSVDAFMRVARKRHAGQFPRSEETTAKSARVSGLKAPGRGGAFGVISGVSQGNLAPQNHQSWESITARKVPITSTAAEHDIDGDIDDQDFIQLANQDFDAGIDDQQFITLAEEMERASTVPIANRSYHEEQPSLSQSRKYGKLLWGTPKLYQPSQKAIPKPVSEGSPDKGRLESISTSTVSSPLLHHSAVCTPSTPCHTPDPSLSQSSQQSSLFFSNVRFNGPFADPAVSSPVGERSPIPGVSSHLRITTHFRLGPALNYAASVWRGGKPAGNVTELYARVLKSYRNGHRQLFELADLFHFDRPPFLSGEWIGWQGLPYFELDGEAFLETGREKKICRAVGRIERDASRHWRMCILSVWEASWDDVEAVKSVICI